MRPRDTAGRELPLDVVQQWMQSVVTQAPAVEPALEVSDVVTASATLSAAQRVAIYTRSYHARLLDTFRTMFPALRHALGDEVFDAFALDYLRCHPPRGASLDRLADRFPQHLADTRPDAGAPAGERESWPDFIVDLALVDWSFRELYDGAGVEGERLPGARDVMAIGDERLLAARPVPVPCLRRFALRYPVHPYLLAARRGAAPSLPAPAECFLAMARHDYRVTIHELTRPQDRFLGNLDGRRTVAAALAASPDGPQPELAQVSRWLCDWAANGLLLRIPIDG